MFNWQTGKWNPSKDNFRYDQSNSITTIDAMTMGAGLRRWGIGGKPPLWARAGNRITESSYRGIRKGYQWKKKIDKTIEKKLKNVDKSRIGKLPDKKLRASNALRRVGRIANSKKGRATIAGLIANSGLGTMSRDSTRDSEWIPARKKKRKGAFFR